MSQAGGPDAEAGAGADSAKPPRLSQAELEAAIVDRQRHLSDTLDELSRRLEPARLARTTVADARASAVAQVVDSRGALRTERVAAVAAAIALIIITLVVARVRTRRRHR